MAQTADIYGNGFGETNDAESGPQCYQRKEQGPNRIDMHDRIERYAAEESARRITQTVGRPRVRGFMYRQGKQKDDESDQNLRDVDVQQGLTGYGRAAKKEIGRAHV